METEVFIAREEEKRILYEALQSKRKSTVLLYGRRRIGKTALVKEVLRNMDDAIIIYHEFHKVTPEVNLAEFSSSIGAAFSIPSLPAFSSFMDAFLFIGAMGKKAIVVMDEYSDLKDNARKGEVDSYMRSVVDNLPDNAKLVVMGSMLKLMKELLEEDNPLFARFSTVIKLGPLSYIDAAKFFPGLPLYEKMQLYSVFGGSPYVLSLLDEGKGLRGNIEDNIISLSGSIRSYIEAVINMEAGRIPHGITILTLIKNGKRRYSELEAVIGKSASGVLANELKKLVELEIVEKIQPINRSDRSKCFYVIADPLIRFYFAYIHSNPSLLMSNSSVFYGKFIERSIRDFIARRFEAACREYFAELVKRGKRNDILDIGTYWYDDRVNKTNGEFGVALKNDCGYEIYDAKFLMNPYPEKEAEKELKQIRALSIPVSGWGVISASGFEKQSSSYIQITLDDMFALE